jgi:hypothetical protein
VQTLLTPPDIQGFYVAEPAERIDGALFDWSWNDAASSRGRWEKAAPIGNASERGAVLQNHNWQLMPNSLPAMQMGKKAPAFSARDQFGRLQTLDTLKGTNGTVLLFFRSADW